ncbi:hypothetical protein [Hydrogenimonas sp. SS33]|uniref:hypothetical protein n=1 Tax=Hydrogenimonas leucolamina TaxID=2954236 RepID=UPI00336BC095
MNLEACLKAYLKELEDEVMRILSDPKTDKKTKNLAMKPLSSKKQIVLNTMDALKMVDKAHEEEMRKADASGV